MFSRPTFGPYAAPPRWAKARKGASKKAYSSARTPSLWQACGAVSGTGGCRRRVGRRARGRPGTGSSPADRERRGSPSRATRTRRGTPARPGPACARLQPRKTWRACLKRSISRCAQCELAGPDRQPAEDERDPARTGQPPGREPEQDQQQPDGGDDPAVDGAAGAGWRGSGVARPSGPRAEGGGPRRPRRRGASRPARVRAWGPVRRPSRTCGHPTGVKQDTQSDPGVFVPAPRPGSVAPVVDRRDCDPVRPVPPPEVSCPSSSPLCSVPRPAGRTTSSRHSGRRCRPCTLSRGACSTRSMTPRTARSP